MVFKAAVLVVVTGLVFGSLSSCTRKAQERDCVHPQVMNNLRLLLSAGMGNVAEMDAMIKAGADVNISDGIFGTPIVAAASSGSSEAVAFLLDKGADVNATDIEGYTPLMKAVWGGDVKTVRLLISRGANANAATYPLINGKRADRFNALIIAEWKKNQEIIKLLKDAGAKEQ